MNLQDFNPNNKITFRSGNYLTAGYSFKTLLENKGIEYFSTEESKFSDGDYFLYFKDKDYEKALSVYNKFLDDLKNVVEQNKSKLDDNTDTSESLDVMAKFMRNSTLQIIIAIIIIFLGMYLTNLFSK